MKIWTFLMLSFLVDSSFALTGSAETQNTSDNIYLNSFAITPTIEDLGLSLEALTQNMEFRNEARRDLLMHKLLVGYKTTVGEPHRFSFAVGANWLDNNITVEDEVVGRAEYRYVKDWMDLGLRVERISLSENLRTTSFLGFSTMEFNSTLDFKLRPVEKWRFSGFYRESFLSDHNSSKSYDAQTMYAISPGWPWIWAGYGATGLHFEQNSVGYWSPKDFFNHGPRIDTSFAIFGKISGIAALNYNFYRENSVSGEGYLAAAGLQWGQFDGNNVKLVYSKIRSGQNQNPWIYEGLRLSCQILSF